MVPSLNFTVRPRPFEAKLAESADAPDSAAVVAVTAVNDTLRAVQYRANSRRFSDLVPSLFTVIPFHRASRARLVGHTTPEPDRSQSQQFVP
jgi:hypothetical protein